MSDWADPATDRLAARIASGAALIAFGLGAAWLGGPWFAAATGAAATAMAFEYARMSEPRRPGPAFALVTIGALVAIGFASWAQPTLAALGLVAAALAAAVWPEGKAGRLWSALGPLYVGAPCAAFVWLRGGEFGLAIILALFAVIWSADTAAYFCGRFIKGPRLAPSLSPNKTWAGLAGGVCAGAFAGAAIAGHAHGPLLAWVALGALFAAIGLAGDLFESLLKRRFGVKDASNLIPGHGGVLDRLDGLMAAALAAAMGVALAPGARDVLFGSTA